ncbi:SLC13 family permease [Maricaulis sp.]|uniref:SLC13 family permease n=1 Tax=Maricaulis sp. TaxID=1486257 RepID=UPI0025B9C4E7|nr:SLC13 family permease [Maricaulis sp.]
MSAILIDTVLVVMLGAILLSGRLSTARAFALFTAAVILTGRISFDEALARLTTPAILAVTSLVIIASALAKLPGLSRAVFGSPGRAPRLTLLRFLGSAALASSVTPNTAVVAALLGPAVRRPDISPHLLLLPLSYMALAGGMLTPFGTSASLMVTGEAARLGIELSVFDFAFPGAVVALSVFAALVLAAPVILKERKAPETDTSGIFHIEARIEDTSALAGRSVATAQLRKLHSFYLAEIVRGNRVIRPVHPAFVLNAGDRLIFVGDVSHFDELHSISGLTLDAAPKRQTADEFFHAVISGQSLLDGKTLREADFRARFNASVMAVRRGDERLSGKLGDIRLRTGDVLILSAGPDFGSRDNVRPNLLILDVDTPGQTPMAPRTAWALGLSFAAFLVIALTQAIPFHHAALALAALVVGLNWASAREVRRSFPFDLVIILWGAVLLSLLITQSGAAATAANFIAAVTGELPPYAALAIIFFFAWAMTELFSNASAALTALPVALATANQLGLPPEAFALATAFGASASFFMPFGYQTHLMVITPGRYRLSDFLALGSVVFVAYATGALTILTLFYL